MEKFKEIFEAYRNFTAINHKNLRREDFINQKPGETILITGLGNEQIEVKKFKNDNFLVFDTDTNIPSPIKGINNLIKSLRLDI